MRACGGVSFQARLFWHHEAMNTQHIPLDLLEPSPYQPREEMEDLDFLVESIREIGLLHPLVARPLGNGRYELLAGHRRLEALRRLGWLEAPVVVREVSDEEARRILLHENQARQELRPYEVARHIQRDLVLALGLGEGEVLRLLSRMATGKPVPEEAARKVRAVLRAYRLSPASFYTRYRYFLDADRELLLALGERGMEGARRLREYLRWLESWVPFLEAALRAWESRGGEMGFEPDPLPLLRGAFLRFLRERVPTGEEGQRVLRRLLQGDPDGFVLPPPMRSSLLILRGEAPRSLSREELEEILVEDFDRYRRALEGMERDLEALRQGEALPLPQGLPHEAEWRRTFVFLRSMRERLAGEDLAALKEVERQLERMVWLWPEFTSLVRGFFKEAVRQRGRLKAGDALLLARYLDSLAASWEGGLEVLWQRLGVPKPRGRASKAPGKGMALRWLREALWELEREEGEGETPSRPQS